MLIAKGYSPSFEMVAGKIVRAPKGAALLHDPTGRAWPSCSGLVMTFTKGGGPIEDRDAEDYLGVGPLRGSLEVPPKALREWKPLGEVEVVNYRRIGKHAAPYYHPIEGGKALLYRRGRALRIELGSGCVWSWRGIVRP
jgi:hypothetical protein